MTRRLAAALACRVQGSRLYGKPLQNLERDYTIIDHILACVRATPEIDCAVLGISEGIENTPFVETAKRSGAAYIIGDQKDVMWRLIQCARSADASDVFRITTECPFTIWEMVPDAWRRHVANGNEITVVDRLPEGVHFEIYTRAALERCHAEGLDADRSEYVSNYARLNQRLFKCEILLPNVRLRRADLRLTVDYPEDLVVCRRVYEALREQGPRIPISDIVQFLDRNPELVQLVRPYTVAQPIWDGVQQRAGK